MIAPEVVIGDRWKRELDEIWSDPANYGLGFVFRDEGDDEEAG